MKKFKNHLEKLQRPNVRKIFNPDASTNLTDKEYFKRKKQLSRYYNFLTIAKYGNSVIGKKLKNRVLDLVQKILKQNHLHRLSINPGDIAIETENDYNEILKFYRYV